MQDVIRGSLRKNIPLQTVLVALANQVFYGNPIPDYDGFDKLVTDVLRQAFPNEKCFSWVLKNLENEIVEVAQEEKVQESIARVHLIKIGDIKVPKKLAEYKNFNYSKVNDKFFLYSLRSTARQ